VINTDAGSHEHPNLSRERASQAPLTGLLAARRQEVVVVAGGVFINYQGEDSHSYGAHLADLDASTGPLSPP
jgi:hypothetical protein